MTLAAILAVSFLSSGWLQPSIREFALRQADQQPPAATSSGSSAPQKQDEAPQPQAPPGQTPDSTPPSPSPTGQTPNSTDQAKPSPKPQRHHKKASTPNCSPAPTALNPAVGDPAGSANSTSAGSTGTGSTNSASTTSPPTNSGSTNSGSASSGSAPLKPCPPPKKVVRNGGTEEPAVQLTGGTPAEQASHQRSTTEQITAATEENLKKVAGRQLTPSQQETVNQIHQFMEQSKTAVAAGDLERSHNLAMKAHLLSDELVKPE
jgi:hypothetical protein